MNEIANLQVGSNLDRLVHNYHGPVFSIRLWDGWEWTSSQARKPACTIVLNTPKALESLVARPNEITLGEAFIHREVDIEGDIFSVFAVAEHILSQPRTLRKRLSESSVRAFFDLRHWLRHGFRHSLERDSSSISYHYDQPVEFFHPWLGDSLAYSCAYFREPCDSLDSAQEQKLALTLRKLRLQPRERFLDIGCGWGSLILRAARDRHANAHGITLSAKQADVARRRIEKSGLGHRCAVELRDYRDLRRAPESYDKIASVGMFEHVGLRNLPQYFSVVRDVLRPGGVFLNHGIARSHSSPARKASFIDRYVFPDGELVTLSQALEAAESVGFEVRDVENLREHYELTLRNWVRGLERSSGELLGQVSDVVYRIWLLYLAGSAAAFARGDIAVYQVLLSRPLNGCSGLPLTRDDWYPTINHDAPDCRATLTGPVRAELTPEEK